MTKDIRALAKIVMAITMAGKVGTCMDQLKHTMTDKTLAYKLFNQGRLLTTTGNWHIEVDELDGRTLEEARVILLDEYGYWIADIEIENGDLDIMFYLKVCPYAEQEEDDDND